MQLLIRRCSNGSMHYGHPYGTELYPLTCRMLMLSWEINSGGVVQNAFVDERCAYIPDMASVIIPNAAHEIHHDQPDAFMQAVLAFYTARAV
jgi:hypothetical protein